jgi:hypothetical protein
VTHYYLADKRPFLNLSDLSDAELESVMSDLEWRRAHAGLRRVFGRRYMELRRHTETKLRRLFVDAGGRPERTAPHYFVLGSSAWYRGLAPHTREVAIPLSELPADVTSLTYGPNVLGHERWRAIAHDAVFAPLSRAVSGWSNHGGPPPRLIAPLTELLVGVFQTAATRLATESHADTTRQDYEDALVFTLRALRTAGPDPRPEP